ncbi:MAG: single-stranded-DNA-specific exonuclease RecJ, partial [Hyphomicrobiales bacterium]
MAMSTARELSSLELPGSFLGVERSLRGRQWVGRLRPDAEAVSAAMAQRHGLSDVLSRILAGRGVGADEAPGFLDPSIRSLMPDP